VKKISDKEKQRILELHHKTPMKPYLFEQLLPAPQLVPIEQIKLSSTPLKNNIEGDEFRKWVNTNFKNIATHLQLSEKATIPYGYNNTTIQRTWNYPMASKLDNWQGKTLGDIYRNEKFNKENLKKALQYGVDYMASENRDRYYTNPDGTPYRELPPEGVEFYNRLQPLLEKAKNWWRKWLNNPETRIKFKKLNGIWFDFTVDYWFNRYLNCVNNVELAIFLQISQTVTNYTTNSGVRADGCPDPEQSINGCVHSDDLTKINVNLLNADRTNDAWVGTLVHEIQHLLYYIKPMTPNKSITQFRGSDDCYNKNKEIYNNTEIQDKDKLLQLKIDDKKINSIANDLGFDIKRTKQIVTAILRIAYDGWDESYFRGNNSELLSRIQGTRLYLLGNTNRTNFTKQDFIKYFNDNQKTILNNDDGNVPYILGYWVSQDFPPLESFINELNTNFVKTDQKNIKSSKIGKYLPQQPNKIDPNTVS
jgi:hypothetical protein